MRTARRASNVEVPSFLRQLVKETEKMVTFFFKGGPRERGSEEEEDNFNGDGAMQSPYLERPILEKHVSEGGSQSGLNYAVASMQGWRAQMEDAHTCMSQLKGELQDWGYFAVFDGHAGTTVAQYCSRNLLDHILTTGAQALQIKHNFKNLYRNCCFKMSFFHVQNCLFVALTQEAVMFLMMMHFDQVGSDQTKTLSR